MQAKAIFDAVTRVVDRACESRGFQEVCDSAAKLGMAGGRVSSFNILKYEFTYADGKGGIITLNVRSYDPSGPSQNQPDINRFTVKLLCDGREVESHDRSYED
jgi:hypothetical protein